MRRKNLFLEFECGRGQIEQKQIQFYLFMQIYNTLGRKSGIQLNNSN